MKKFFIVISTVLLLSCNVYAYENDDNIITDFDYNFVVENTSFPNLYQNLVSPMYEYISEKSNNLNITSSGNAECYGLTKTNSNYSAKVTVELQKQNGNNWTTIKEWSSSSNSTAIVSQNYQVSKGYSYRLKTTHYAINSSGKPVETIIKYSSTNIY